jgi:CMP-N-acetylneuraminic acid synthetase
MTIAIMPLKANSERIPGKNFRNLAGKVLYRWTLEKLLQLKNEGILSAVNLYCDAHTWRMIDSDIKMNVEWIAEEKPGQFQESNGFLHDMVVKSKCGATEPVMYANATSPFVKLDTYIQCCEAVENGEYDSALTAIPLIGRLWNEDDQAVNHNPQFCPRTQTQEPCWIESDGAWVMEPDVICRFHHRVGMRPKFVSVDWVEQVDINYPEDFEKAENFLKIGVVTG